MYSFFDLKTIKSIFIGSILGLVIVYFIRFYSLQVMELNLVI